MKFLLELVTCSGSCSADDARKPVDETSFLVPETRFLVVSEPPRRRSRRKHAGRSGDWRPSLSAISEDALIPERMKKKVDRPAEWRKELKRKVSSVSQRDPSRSFNHDDHRREITAGMMSASFAPPAFMF